MTRAGFFVTFEGPEGSGKSSQAKRLVRALRARRKSVVFICDPGSTPLGRRLRQTLLHDGSNRFSPLAEAMLFLAGRLQLIQARIRPALQRGAIVVCDRFHDSTVAYQGFGGRVDVHWLDQLGRAVIDGILPDLTVLLDVPTAVGFARVGRQRDRMEQKARAFHKRVRTGYRQLAQREPQRFVVVDGTQPKAEIARQILHLVLARLSNKQTRAARKYVWFSTRHSSPARLERAPGRALIAHH